MAIPKCCGEVVENNVNGKEFYFCRGCRKEVGHLPTLQDPPEDDEFMPSNNIIIQSVGKLSYRVVGGGGGGGGASGAGSRGFVQIPSPPSSQVKCPGCPVTAVSCTQCGDSFNKNVSSHKWVNSPGAFNASCVNCNVTNVTWPQHQYEDCSVIQAKAAASKAQAPILAHGHIFYPTDVLPNHELCINCGLMVIDPKNPAIPTCHP